jgi:hypothetical protein
MYSERQIELEISNSNEKTKASTRAT